MNPWATGAAVAVAAVATVIIFLVDRYSSRESRQRCTSYGKERRERCCVCLRDFELARLDKIRLPCGDVFCKQCATVMGREQETCPQCRRVVFDNFTKLHS